MKKDSQDRIDEYILGKMSDEDKAQLEAEINQNESKREQLEFTKNVRSAIISRENKLARIRMLQRMYARDYHQVAASIRATGTYDCQCAPTIENIPIPQRAKRGHTMRMWWYVSGIAAVLVLGLFMVNPFRDDISPLESSPKEVIRGEDSEVFDVAPLIINDTIVNDTIPRDTIIIR